MNFKDEKCQVDKKSSYLKKGFVQSYRSVVFFDISICLSHSFAKERVFRQSEPFQ